MIIRLLCSWGFSRQEYWGGLPCPPPGDLPNPGIKPRSPTLQVDSLPSEPICPSPGELSNAGIEPESPALQADSLPAELPGRPRNLSKFYPNKVSVLPPHGHIFFLNMSRNHLNTLLMCMASQLPQHTHLDH